MTRDGNTVTVTCASFHLTSFAVLVDVGGAQVHIYNIVVYTSVAIIYMCICCIVYAYTMTPATSLLIIVSYIIYTVILIQLEDEALQIVSYIGLAISLACLLLTIIFFLSLGYIL